MAVLGAGGRGQGKGQGQDKEEDGDRECRQGHGRLGFQKASARVLGRALVRTQSKIIGHSAPCMCNKDTTCYHVNSDSHRSAGSIDRLSPGRTETQLSVCSESPMTQMGL